MGCSPHSMPGESMRSAGTTVLEMIASSFSNARPRRSLPLTGRSPAVEFFISNLDGTEKEEEQG